MHMPGPARRKLTRRAQTELPVDAKSARRGFPRWIAPVPAEQRRHVVRRSSNGKAGAAAAGGRGVRIVDLKMGTDQLVGKIDFGPSEEIERDGIDQQLDTIALDYQVVRALEFIQGEGVLEAGAAAAGDRDPKFHRRRLTPQNLGDAPCGAGGKENWTVAHGKSVQFGLPVLCSALWRGSKVVPSDQRQGRLVPPLFVPPSQAAPFATQVGGSRGRVYHESESATRTDFQRDRDRILHSSAFRRLKHKTQVFVQHEGDYYRTRLTHSLEVAQIARSIARVLALDEDLAEAVALAHDLGHTPFGHAGEEALADATAQFGGFDHNAHALKLVTQLEHRYADFDGLNLTWECLEGLVKHNGPLVGRAVPGPIASFNARFDLVLDSFAGLEAQVASLADDIAYINHDIDDGLRAGLFDIQALAAAPLAGGYVGAVQKSYGNLELSRFVGELVRRLMSAIITDLLEETRLRLERLGPRSVHEIRVADAATAAFSPPMAENIAALKAWLFSHMYRHPRVMQSMAQAKLVISELFRGFHAEPALLPADWAGACIGAADAARVSIVRDYIAGMTDRFALSEFERLFHTQIAL